MTIDKVIRLWDKSKYDTLVLRSMPCVNHLGEITYGTGFYKKNETIICGGTYKVSDYLLKLYKHSIFMFDENLSSEDSIGFQMILNIEDV